MEFIAARKEDWWVCLCGNEPDRAGFFPCNREGEPVEPTPADWTTDCYVCEQCGRIIRQADRCVIGVRSNNALSDAECKQMGSDANRGSRQPRPATAAEITRLIDWLRGQEGPIPSAVFADLIKQSAYIAVFEQTPNCRSRYDGWVMSVVWESGPKHSDLFIRHSGKLIRVVSLPIYAANW